MRNKINRPPSEIVTFAIVNFCLYTTPSSLTHKTHWLKNHVCTKSLLTFINKNFWKNVKIIIYWSRSTKKSFFFFLLQEKKIASKIQISTCWIFHLNKQESWTWAHTYIYIRVYIWMVARNQWWRYIQQARRLE